MGKKSQVFLLLLCAALVLGGCGKKEVVNELQNYTVIDVDGKQMVGNTYLEGFPIVKDQITMRIMARKQPSIGNYNEMDFTKTYEEMTNIRIEWEEVLSDNWNEKLNLVFAAGDYPDVVMGQLSNQQINQYADENIVLPLSELIDNFAPNVKNMFEKEAQVKKFCMLNGEIYSLPTKNTEAHNVIQYKWYMNQEWLAKINKPAPTTTDELYEVLKAFKGLAEDAAPLSFACSGSTVGSGAFQTILGPWGVVYDEKYDKVMINDNNKVSFAPIEEGYKEGLKFYAKLYKEGLLDNSIFYQTAQQLNARMASEKITVGSVLTSSDTGFLDNRPKYDILVPLKGPEGKQLYFKRDTADFVNAKYTITNKCQDPVAAIRWADYAFTDEGLMFFHLGPKGILWDVNSNGMIEEFNNPPSMPAGMSLPEFRGNVAPGITQSPGYVTTELESIWLHPEDNIRLDAQAEKTRPYWGKIFPPILLETESIEKISELSIGIKKYTEEMLARFIMGEIDIDTQWDTYVSTLKKMNVDQLVDIYQREYDKYNKLN